MAKKALKTVSLAELTKYFADEKDIYIQNVSSGLVSLSFGDRDEIGYTVPNTPNPVCLTSIIPFHLVKKSITFRKALLRNPPFIKLFTEEEYKEFFARKSVVAKKTAEELISDTEVKQMKLQNKEMEPVKEEPTPVVNSSTEPETMDEILTPRVIQIISTLNPQTVEGVEPIILQPNEISDIIDELDTIDLNLDDLEYIRSQGKFKTVKKWAADKAAVIEEQASLTADEIVKIVN